MLRPPIIFLIFYSLIKGCTSEVVATIPIEGSIKIGDGSSPANIYISLNGDQYTTMASVTGRFAFHSIPTGIYALDVLSLHDLFPQMKLKVDAEKKEVTVVEYKYPGAKRSPASYPIELVSLVPLSYYQQRPPFSILGMILQNPMIILMLGALVLVSYMSQMTKGLDEEALKELQSEDPMRKMKQMFGIEKKAPDDDDD